MLSGWVREPCLPFAFPSHCTAVPLVPARAQPLPSDSGNVQMRPERRGRMGRREGWGNRGLKGWWPGSQMRDGLNHLLFQLDPCGLAGCTER